MHFNTQDPDIETIVRRIRDEEYDLQPDFQRGDVWTPIKQKRLIDSILRDWHIPPVHLVAREDGLSDVLDGQQRLTAIRDFMDGEFAVDGTIEPRDPAVAALHGLTFDELPDDVKRRFKRFTIRVFELTQYAPDEPHELFFRLNQPTNLTEAEKRNAFIGPPRNEVKALATFASRSGMTYDRVGFSNARLAYDDVLARVLVTLESRSLDAKVTAARITERYRRMEPFPDPLLNALKDALELFLSLPELDHVPRVVRPNKATVHTWLCAAGQSSLAGFSYATNEALRVAILQIEEMRWTRLRTGDLLLGGLMVVFQDRSTARVADVSSVLIRDLITWMMVGRSDNPELGDLAKYQVARSAWGQFDPDGELDEQLYSFATRNEWGRLGW